MKENLKYSVQKYQLAMIGSKFQKMQKDLGVKG